MFADDLLLAKGETVPETGCFQALRILILGRRAVFRKKYQAGCFIQDHKIHGGNKGKQHGRGPDILARLVHVHGQRPDVSATFASSNPNTALSLGENAGEVTATVQASNPDSDNTVLSGDRATISGQGNPGITVKATSEGHIWAYSGTENGEAPFYSSEIPESSLYIDEGTLTTQVPVSDDAILWIMTRIEDLAETHFQVEDSLVFTDIVDSTTISGVHIREARLSNYGISKPMDKAQVVVEITEEL